jgi:hypothetical protein
MADINLPVGNSNFADIIENNYYYVDKTGLIEEILRDRGVQVTLITRPRRFGKTLAMTMLAEFLKAASLFLMGLISLKTVSLWKNG